MLTIQNEWAVHSLVQSFLCFGSSESELLRISVKLEMDGCRALTEVGLYYKAESGNTVFSKPCKTIRVYQRSSQLSVRETETRWRNERRRAVHILSLESHRAAVGLKASSQKVKELLS